MQYLQYIALRMQFTAGWQACKKAAQILQKQNQQQKPDPQNVLRRRINQYFLYNHCEKVEYDKPILRPQVDYNDPSTRISDSKLTVFGVDYLSNKQLKAYFDNPKQVKRITQSCACVDFQSREGLLEALKKQSMEYVPDDFDVRAEYQLRPYTMGKKEIKLIARCFVNTDSRMAEEQADSNYVNDTAKKIYTEKQNSRGPLLPPRRKMIRKQPEESRFVRQVDNTLVSFEMGSRQHIDSSFEAEMEESLQSKNAGTADDPIDLDLDISAISMPKDRPAIYGEQDDQYRFKTHNYKTKFREHRDKLRHEKHFNYSNYFKKAEEEEKVPKVQVVVIEE